MNTTGCVLVVPITNCQSKQTYIQTKGQMYVQRVPVLHSYILKLAYLYTVSVLYNLMTSRDLLLFFAHVTDRRCRYSGDIAVYYKHELGSNISIAEKQRIRIVWIRLHATLFSFDEDVYLCCL